jgi:hypothetical protein
MHIHAPIDNVLNVLLMKKREKRKKIVDSFR